VLKDVLIEIWQANADGKYAHPADRQPGKALDPHFRGWGRSCTDFDSGVYTFDTIKPGAVEAATAGPWRRTSTPGSSPAASTSASTPASTSATRRRRTPRTR
jgi:protocatechuate 3,4-dioxygenase beta subunit